MEPKKSYIQIHFDELEMNLASARPPVTPGCWSAWRAGAARSQPQRQHSQQLFPVALTIAGTPASAAALPKVKPAKGVCLHAPANSRALVSPANAGPTEALPMEAADFCPVIVLV